MRESATLQQIVDEQRSFATDIAAGKKDDRDAKRLSRIPEAQADVSDLAEGRKELSRSTPIERFELKNAPEAIQAALTGSFRAEERRDICRHERMRDSRVSKMRCATKEKVRIARAGGHACLERPFGCAGSSCA